MSFTKTTQQSISKEYVATFLSQYNLIDQDFNFKPATSGIENTTIIISVASGKNYVLRVYRPDKKTRSDIALEIDFMRQLQDAGLAVPEIYPNKSDDYITSLTYQDTEQHAILMKYVAGHHAESYSHHLISQLAVAQAKIHQIGIHLAGNERLKPTEQTLRETEFTRLATPEMLVDKSIADLIDRAAKYTVTLSSDLSYGYSHFDYDVENVLIDTNENIQAILDFDDMHYAPVVKCLAFTLWHILIVHQSPELLAHYIQSYETIRPLKDLEKSYILQIMLSRHYAIGALSLLRGELQNDIDMYLYIENYLKTVDKL